MYLHSIQQQEQLVPVGFRFCLVWGDLNIDNLTSIKSLSVERLSPSDSQKNVLRIILQLKKHLLNTRQSLQKIVNVNNIDYI